MARLRRVAQVLIGFVLAIVFIIGLAIATLETHWGKNQIRRLIVAQANKYLTATLEIESLSGSLFRGIELGHVRLSRDGRPLVAIDAITVDYSIRQLLGPGVVIRRVRLIRPRIVGARQADGRWDLGALVKSERHEQQRSGPGRPIEVQAIEIVDGEVRFKDPLDFGDAHAPTTFESLNASLSFAYHPVQWGLTFNWISWIGSQPALTMTGMTGTFGHGPGGWFFDTLRVITSHSTFTLSGTIDTDEKPTQFNLRVVADRFTFQEWAGVLHGLRNIAVESSFETLLNGKPRALGVELKLKGTGGAVRGHLTLDTTEPGWHGRGTVDVERLELGHWLNRPDRPSDITGQVVFDLSLGLGQHFPRGTYRFTGPRAAYMGYAASDLRAEGRITKDAVLIERAAAAAYSATVSVSTGSIGLEDPYPFRFAGQASRVDLRRLPATVPVPRVESVLAFQYDVSGRFSNPFIVGRATFGSSRFLGASIGAGAVGTIDTSRVPLRYSGDGEITAVNVTRFGQGLDVAWMRDPRYAGTISGRFHVDGSGHDRDQLTLTVTGRLTRADLFSASFTDADVSMNISRETLTATYDGAFQDVNPAVPFADDRFAATLSGTGCVTATVRNLLAPEPLTLDDYDISGTLALEDSSVRGVDLSRASVDAALHDKALSITQLEVSGPAVEGTGSGSVVFGDPTSVDFAYDATWLDLGALKDATHVDASGIVATKGHATGPMDALGLAGDLSASDLDAYGVAALTLTGTYDVTIDNGHALMRGELGMHASFMTVFGTALQEASGTATYDASTLKFDVGLVETDARQGHLAGTVTISEPHADAMTFTIAELQATLGTATWRLASSSVPPTVTWTEGEIDVTPMAFLTPGDGEGRVTVSGSWRRDGAGVLRIAASQVFLESLQGGGQRPSRFGGLIEADMTLSGTRDHPTVSGTATITNGRVERVGYQQLTAQISYADQLATVDLRLEQSADVAITAVGTVPLALFDSSAPDRKIDLTVRSSAINLGLLEGLTNIVREVSGEGRFDVHVVGTGREPHFDGSVSLTNVGFVVVTSGSRYRNGNAAIRVSPDRITVESLQLQDAGGHVLEVKGNLGAAELGVGELQLDAVARRFEVLRNDLGRVNVDAALSFRGTITQPRVTVQLAVTSSEIRVDEVLSRALFQPYSTTPTELPQLDAVAALNPWQRVTLDVALSVPRTLRLAGSNVQIAPGTPIGISDINLRVGGDLDLYKGQGDPLSITGSLDSINGAVGFQGRRFTVDESASSINFQGDLNPELFISVTRQIAAVETRVTVSGQLKQPELQLSSVPPLDSSDILSLIVFNTTTNELTPQQQQELVVRAGTLAAGFLAAPIVSAIQQQIGLQVLNIEPSTDIINMGPRVTVGQELAPGLMVQFSRQFGTEPYDQATLEFYLTRILRLRATFSDAQSLVALSPFRRQERAGIDLLFFFSF